MTGSARSPILGAGLVLALLAFPVPAGEAGPATVAAAALDTLRSLEGEWRGTNAKGWPVTVRYEVVSDGTAVLEHMNMRGEANHHDMVTLFHLDGERLLLTHYCAVGNQPRMQATSLGEKEMRFEFVDATGMASPDEGHMHSATFSLPAPDRLEAAWTWREGGEDAFTEVLSLERAPGDGARD